MNKKGGKIYIKEDISYKLFTNIKNVFIEEIKPNFYYFTPDNTKQKLLLGLPKVNQKLLLKWEDLLLLGNDNDKNIMNKFRQEYVNKMLKIFNEKCNSNSNKILCNIQIVGCGNDNILCIKEINPPSDIDINFIISIPKENETLQYTEYLKFLVENTKDVIEFHNKYFKGVFYDDLFDINIYYAQLPKDSDILNKPNSLIFDNNLIISQTNWACIRALDILNKNNSELINIFPCENPEYENTQLNFTENIFELQIFVFKMLEKNFGININEKIPKILKIQSIENISQFFTNIMIDKKLKTLHTKEENIKKYIYAILSALLYTNPDAGLFSLSKMFERETYRSLGAYLHIVEGNKKMNWRFYAHSILDNYGFLLENYYHNISLSPEPSLQRKIKVSSFTLSPLSSPRCQLTGIKNKCRRQLKICSDIIDTYKIPFKITYTRVAKYLERICDAMELSVANDNMGKDDMLHEIMSKYLYKIKKIKIICNKINKKRKNNVITDKDFTNFIELFPDITNNNNYYDIINIITEIFIIENPLFGLNGLGLISSDIIKKNSTNSTNR